MIRLENVTHRYDARHEPALRGVDLSVDRGQFVFLVGESGSGKSTVLRLLIAEFPATSGRITVAGDELARLPRRRVAKLRRGVGVVFQDFRLLAGRTVEQNVAYALQVLGARRSTIRRRVPETLEMVGLAERATRLPHELSGGEQQRVAIARAMVNEPAILLADEPTGNLDPRTSRDIVDILERINKGGTTVVMATHDTVIVNALRKRVVGLQDGEVVSDEVQAMYRAQARPTRTTAPTPSTPSTPSTPPTGPESAGEPR